MKLDEKCHIKARKCNIKGTFSFNSCEHCHNKDFCVGNVGVLHFTYGTPQTKLSMAGYVIYRCVPVCASVYCHDEHMLLPQPSPGHSNDELETRSLRYYREDINQVCIAQYSSFVCVCLCVCAKC